MVGSIISKQLLQQKIIEYETNEFYLGLHYGHRANRLYGYGYVLLLFLLAFNFDFYHNNHQN